MRASVTYNDQTYTLDDQGFLDPPEQWDENFAEGMARTLGIFGGLSERHWQFVHYLRDRFVNDKTIPTMVIACLENQMRLAEFRARFPTGFHRGACKVAGIDYAFMSETHVALTYETTSRVKPRYRLSALGFLEDFDAWDEDFVRWLVFELPGPSKPTERHWEVIRFLRDYFQKHQNVPTIYEACTVCNLSLEELDSLFPAGYRRGACRLAGLPYLA